MYCTNWQRYATEILINNLKKMNIYEIMRLLGIETINEFIEMIKLKGTVINLTNSVLALPNDRYAERALLMYDNRYYVTYVVSENFLEQSPWEDIHVFENGNDATNDYNNLVQMLNAEIYE
ncbi:MAG: hypothetical protein RLZZ540_1251 [Bacteroidota bacterium]|jgi:hypothetical protein